MSMPSTINKTAYLWASPTTATSYRNIDIVTVITWKCPLDFRNELKLQYRHQKKRQGTGLIEINLQYSVMGKKITWVLLGD